MEAIETMMEEYTAPDQADKVPFMEAAGNLDLIMRAVDIHLTKVDMITESAEREYKLNIAQAQLKCLQEGGTQDDLAFLEDAAEEGFVSKLHKAIDKLIQVWKDFISKIKTKVASSLCSAESRATLLSVERKVKLNPILARKQIVVPNVKPVFGIIAKYKSHVDKDAAKIARGLITEHTASSLVDLKQDFRKQFTDATMGDKKFKAITVMVGIKTLNAEINRLPQFIDNCEKDNNLMLEKLRSSAISQLSVASATALTQQCANFRTELAKEEVNQSIKYCMALSSALRQAAKSVAQKVKDKVTGNKASKQTVAVDAVESAEELDDEYGSEYEDEFGDSYEDDYLSDDTSYDESELDSYEDSTFDEDIYSDVSYDEDGAEYESDLFETTEDAEGGSSDSLDVADESWMDDILN